MKRALAALLASACLSTGAWAQSQPGSSSGDGYDQYNVLTERNMFLRERRRARPVTSQPVTTRAVESVPETPEQRYVLRGVVIEENDELRAYFENIRSAEGLRVKPGDAIGSGHVAEIRIDAVAYASPDGRITWVDVGHNLNGVRDVRSPTPSAGATAGGTPAATPGGTSPATAPTDPALLSIEERMRLRRQQRGGG